MKKLLIIVVFVSFQLSAQASKGSFLVGGNATASYTHTEKEIQGASGFGLAISDHVMVELLLNYRNGDFKSESDFAFDPEYDYKRSILFLPVGFQIYLPRKTN